MKHKTLGFEINLNIIDRPSKSKQNRDWLEQNYHLESLFKYK